MQTGLIDGVYSSPLACLALQWFTRVSYMTDFPLLHAVGAMVVDKTVWEEIPADDRSTVRAIADDHFRRLTEATRVGDRDAIRTMKERGIELVPIAPTDAATFVEQGRKIWYEQADQIYPRALLDQVLAAAEAAASGSGD